MSVEPVRPTKDHRRGTDGGRGELLGATEDTGVSGLADDFEADGDEAAGESGEVIELDEEADADWAPKRLAPDPGVPTADEVAEHDVDHLPYRTWCESCVTGRGTGEQHRKGPVGSVPVIAFDYLLVTRGGVARREEAAPREDAGGMMATTRTLARRVTFC